MVTRCLLPAAPGGTAHAIPCNIRDEESVAACVQQTLDKTGRLDFLINNGGAVNFNDNYELSYPLHFLYYRLNTKLCIFPTIQKSIPYSAIFLI